MRYEANGSGGHPVIDDTVATDVRAPGISQTKGRMRAIVQESYGSR